jgi:hypothetical protein
MAEKDFDNEMETRIWNQFVRHGSETSPLEKSDHSNITKNAKSNKSKFTKSTHSSKEGSQTNNRANLIDSSKHDSFDYYNIPDNGNKK